MPLGQVAAVLKRAWGEDWSTRFRRFSFTPLAAASIGQVQEAEPITALGDFAFFHLEITGGRLVSRFGGAVNLTARTLPSLLAVGTPVAGDFPTN